MSVNVETSTLTTNVVSDVIVGSSPLSLVGFHGEAGSVQAGAISTITGGATGPDIATAVNAIITVLKDKGLTA